MAAQLQEPWQHVVPCVGIVFADSGEEAGKIVEEEHVNSVADAFFQEGRLRLRVSEVHNFASALE